MKQLELDHILTVLYVLVEVARWQQEKHADHDWRNEIADAEPNLLLLLTQMISKLRWEDPSEPTIFSRSRLFLLQWKLSLLLFGNFKEIRQSKDVLRREQDDDQEEHDESFITASPLDYHLFRQEITSKYPAYSPPQPLVSIELENNSILPPLPSHPSRQASQENMQSLAANNPPKGSIFNQPVHIATPAPSPPPSPAGPGGKSGKKQNYQTNQNFPFLYPPPNGSDSRKIDIAGGGTQPWRVQDSRWDDSDVPASILEAGSLFASRMRMSRGLRQLWEVREEYIKAERGWHESLEEGEADSDPASSDEEEVERLYLQEREQSSLGGNVQDQRDGKDQSGSKHDLEQPRVEYKNETDDREVNRRLKAVDDFYVSMCYPQIILLS